jgi:hypothetical protein
MYMPSSCGGFVIWLYTSCGAFICPEFGGIICVLWSALVWVINEFDSHIIIMDGWFEFYER